VSGALRFTPARGLGAGAAYAVPAPPAPATLVLSNNEGPAPDAVALAGARALDPERLRRYARPTALEAQLARRHGARPEQVLVTAGADDALLRIALTALEPGRDAVVPAPTFEMIARYARLAGGAVRALDWLTGPFPRRDVLARIDARTGLVAVVSPNNPTGAVATGADLAALSAGAPGALVLLDHAYAEFADEDLTSAALELPNVVVVRTLSKAWGLAGLRVGYALGAPELVAALRRAGNPYPVAAPSLALASAWLERGAEQVAAGVRRVRAERDVLARALARAGAEPLPSQANFVLARFADAARVWRALADAGIAVRRFDEPALQDFLRITCPCDEAACARLLDALEDLR
jgi:histidinol-phosphate aminotransferase